MSLDQEQSSARTIPGSYISDDVRRFIACQKYRNMPKCDQKPDLARYQHHLFEIQRNPKYKDLPFSCGREEGSAAPEVQSSECQDAEQSESMSGSRPSFQDQTRNRQQISQNAHLQTIPEYPNLHQDDYFRYTPGQVINIKEAGVSPNELPHIAYSQSPKRKQKRRARFADLRLENEDLVREYADNTYPIPYQLEDPPEVLLTPGTPISDDSIYGPFSNDMRDQQRLSPGNRRRVRSSGAGNVTPNRHGGQEAYSPISPFSPNGQTTFSRSEDSGFPQAAYDSGLEVTPPTLSAAEWHRRRQGQKLLSTDMAEVEGDLRFRDPNMYTNPRTAPHPPFNRRPSPASRSSLSPTPSNSTDSENRRQGSERMRDKLYDFEISEFSDDTTTSKPKGMMKKILGKGHRSGTETRMFPFAHKIENGQIIRSADLEVKREWAFVAMSPNSRTIVGVSDRDTFKAYSIDYSSCRLLVVGEFEGEPLAIAVSNKHLAILTLMKVCQQSCTELQITFGNLTFTQTTAPDIQPP